MNKKIFAVCLSLFALCMMPAPSLAQEAPQGSAAGASPPSEAFLRLGLARGLYKSPRCNSTQDLMGTWQAPNGDLYNFGLGDLAAYSVLYFTDAQTKKSTLALKGWGRGPNCQVMWFFNTFRSPKALPFYTYELYLDSTKKGDQRALLVLFEGRQEVTRWKFYSPRAYGCQQEPCRCPRGC